MPTPDPMREDTVFDLASNTKMYATIYALQKLASEGRLDVDAPVSIPAEFADVAGDADRARIRVADLLRHSAGFAADVRFQSPDAGDGRYYSHDRARTERLLPRLPRQYVAGTRNLYSDTDFMLAGMIVERISGQRLDRFVDQAFYRPLGLRRTGFALLRSGRLQRTDFAATELHGNTRDGAVTFPASAATAARRSPRRKGVLRNGPNLRARRPVFQRGGTGQPAVVDAGRRPPRKPALLRCRYHRPFHRRRRPGPQLRAWVAPEPEPGRRLDVRPLRTCRSLWAHRLDRHVHSSTRAVASASCC
jgi:CubicO group peptidase (beta-lactamase class C family)